MSNSFKEKHPQKIQLDVLGVISRSDREADFNLVQIKALKIDLLVISLRSKKNI